MKTSNNYIIYENYKELLEQKPVIAKLEEEVGTGKWQNNELYYYEDLENYAEYELTEGWYVSLNLDREYNGAPNPMDFINLEALGEALSESWDESCHYLTENGEVITTDYGW